jgi:all-trans-8'-apo-beta-carotenal 15,15'-oxygenase
MLHLIPRPGSGKAPESFSIPVDDVSDANAQFINAYEDGDNIIMDAIRSDGSSLDASRSLQWPWAESLEHYRAVASRKSLWRYTIDTRRGVITKTELFPGHSCFGVINPEYSTQRHRFMYMNIGATGAQAAPPQGIACFDCETQQVQTWMPESHEFCGEPMYAPRKGGEVSENSGYILSVLYDGKKKESELIILNASDVSRGPITRLSLGVAVPHGYFGCFTTSEEATWGFEELQRRAKLADKMESRGNMWNEVKSDFSGLGLRFDGKDTACAVFFHT